ncbi:hypothetical protein BDC45DRAFT_500708 [Circinella umbellata]|nr:hypothetical protein BDC45DRAFT_500708 [Circinella umbellata]
MDSTTSMFNNTTINYNNNNNNEQRGMKRKRIASCILSSSTLVLKSSPTQQKKNVRFMEYPTIQYTYSADEYDRGGLFDHAVLYKFNAPIQPSLPLSTSPSSTTTTITSNIPLMDTPSVPSQIYQQPTLTTKPKLSVNIPLFSFVHNDDDQDSATSTEPSPDTPNDNDVTSLCTPPTTIAGTVRSVTKQNRPKLSVDTSICAGPLFFTKLSTNHRSKTSDDDNNSSSFLVPMSALPV